MKKVFFLAGLALALCGNAAFAQCQHTPTVTPNNMIMCPNSTDTLWTQVYDAYQWYKNGNPVSGANSQYLVVDSYYDAGNYFSVGATLNNCTEISAQVLVDGWAFLPPYVMTEGSYTIDNNGVVRACPGDTVYLILGSPYTVNIQWESNHVNVPGGNDDTLMLTSGSGVYTVYGSPAVCPNYVAQLGVTIEVIFSQTPVPSIAVNGSTMQATPSSGYAYQWYIDSNPIPGATTSAITASADGNYWVMITDTIGCSAGSTAYPYFPSGIEEGFAKNVKIYPNPVADMLYIELEGDAQVEIYNAYGQKVIAQEVSGKASISMEHLSSGTYFVRAIDASGNAASFVTVKK
jgi:hypothetical protein